VILLLHVLVSPFKTQARLEAEIVLLRISLADLAAHASPDEVLGKDRRR
jgi:hypothetical protein